MNETNTIWTAASRQSVLDGLAGASTLRILVLGDLMVDQYLLGKVDRISRRLQCSFCGPTPGPTARRRRQRGLNLHLGCDVSIAGIVGDDDHGRRLIAQLGMEGMDTEAC